MEGKKMDVFDLIIEVLRDHEKALDLLVGRLEAITPTLEKEMNL